MNLSIRPILTTTLTLTLALTLTLTLTLTLKLSGVKSHRGAVLLHWARVYAMRSTCTHQRLWWKVPIGDEWRHLKGLLEHAMPAEVLRSSEDGMVVGPVAKVSDTIAAMVPAVQWPRRPRPRSARASKVARTRRGADQSPAEKHHKRCTIGNRAHHVHALPSLLNASAHSAAYRSCSTTRFCR